MSTQTNPATKPIAEGDKCVTLEACADALRRLLRHLRPNEGGASLSDDIWKARRAIEHANAALRDNEDARRGAEHGLPCLDVKHLDVVAPS